MSTDGTDEQPVTTSDVPALFEDFEAWVESYGGRVMPQNPCVAIMPSAFFDEEQLPDVDPMPATVERDGTRQLAVPFVWLYETDTGIVLLSREHVALMWLTSTEQELIEEYKLRRQFDAPIPPVVKRAVSRGVGGES